MRTQFISVQFSSNGFVDPFFSENGASKNTKKIKILLIQCKACSPSKWSLRFA